MHVRCLKKVAVQRSCVFALVAMLAACGAAGPSASLADGEPYDLWIRGGTVVDGSGGDRYQADVLVRGEEIVHVGAVQGEVKTDRVVDATGRIVAPGFIDVHSHGDPLKNALTNFLAQGITTAVLGQDGRSMGFEEHEPGTLEAWRSARQAPREAADADPATMAQWMRRVDQQSSEVNIAGLTGHGTLRIIAGVDRNEQPTAQQLAAMQEILEADMAAGSFGLSLGLEYEPGRNAALDEQKVLSAIVSRNDGIIMSHMRTEDTGHIAGAVDELLALEGHVHVAHMKIVAGEDPAEAQAVLEQMARARATGRRVTGDVYPYLASAANLWFLYPDWARDKADFTAALEHRRPELEAHIRKRVEERLGPQGILIVSGKHAGKRLADLAEEAGQPYEKVILDDLAHEPHQQAHFVMTPQVRDQFVLADHISISTDGGPWLNHPRSAGSTVMILDEFVGEGAGKMSLERAIHKMSGLPAQTMGIVDRGVIREGAKADLLVLSPDRLRNRATWTEPLLPPEGFDVVIVNGRVALEDGVPGNGKHGRMLRLEGGGE